MEQLTDFEHRISAALDRVRQTLDQMQTGGDEDGAVLRAELEAERVANSQLEERVRAIKEKQETKLAKLEDEVARLREVLATRDALLQQARSVNAALRDSNAALREANSKGVGDAGLVIGAMQAELNALRATHAAERAEVEEILSALEPVLKEA